MTEHTPGTWVVSNPEQIGRHIVDSQGGCLADTFSWVGYEQEKANAHLIAAAPDLLAALQKIINNWDNLHAKDRQQARLAIAKAKGRPE